MSRLRIFSESDPDQPLFASDDHAVIADTLRQVGVRFERWQANQPLPPGADQAQVFAAYRADIDRLVSEHDFQSVDVVSITPDHPQRESMRAKFLDEHTHVEAELRFFVAGSGLFSLHLDDRVYEVLCVQGDLIGVPDGVPHWFDMGPNPCFTAIRFFTRPDGWVGHFTGSGIAQRFPRHEEDQDTP